MTRGKSHRYSDHFAGVSGSKEEAAPGRKTVPRMKTKGTPRRTKAQRGRALHDDLEALERRHARGVGTPPLPKRHFNNGFHGFN